MMSSFQDNLFSTLASVPAISSEVAANRGRHSGVYFGTVTDNKDPSKLRRVKAIVNGDTETEWLQSIRSHGGLDTPLPKIGETIIIAYCDGNPHSGGIYFGTTNNSAVPVQSKDSATKDNCESVPGDYRLKVEGEIVLENKAGASLTLTREGYIELEDKDGNRIRLSNNSTWSGPLNFTNPDVSITNKDIATIGAIDDRGHRIIDRGH
jgi:hypothetical protein